MPTERPIESAVGKRVWLIVHGEVQQVERTANFVAVETQESSIDMREVVGWGLYDATKAACANEPHESGMVYDPATDDAVCPLCGKHEPTEMGSM